MEIGIIGLPRSGKTTIFNALTGGSARTATYSSASAAPNVGVAKVADKRLYALKAMFNPQKTTPAEVRYVDVGISREMGKGSGSREFTNHLARCDALLHVVRSFENAAVPHSEGTVNPDRDIGIVDLELMLFDLSTIERREKRIADTLRGARATERDNLVKEQALLARLRGALEAEKPIRELGLGAEEQASISGYQFLSAKPMMLVLNIGESGLPTSAGLEKEFAARFPGRPVCAICGSVEMELSQLGEAESADFRASFGITEPAVNRVIRVSYELLGLISFFTVGSDEVRAWTIKRGDHAPEAAGKVHSDMQRGFIRAEVMSYADLTGCGSIAECKKRGLFRVEGKTYLVQDGDVINFLFSV